MPTIRTALVLALYLTMTGTGVLLLDFGPLERCAEHDCWATWFYEFGPLVSFVLVPIGLLGLFRLAASRWHRGDR